MSNIASHLRPWAKIKGLGYRIAMIYILPEVIHIQDFGIKYLYEYTTYLKLFN